MNEDNANVNELARNEERDGIESNIRIEIQEAIKGTCNLIANYYDDYTSSYQNKLFEALRNLSEAKANIK